MGEGKVALVREFARSGRAKAEDQLQCLLHVIEGDFQEVSKCAMTLLIEERKVRCAT